MEKHHSQHKKVGLALGGGAAKGFAHIGVIKALESAGIGIDFIAGTSMGALVGGYYAATKDINRLETIIRNIKKKDVYSMWRMIKRRDGALFRGESIADLLRKELGDMKVEDCQIPFTAVATNVKNGDEVQLNSGDLVNVIEASSAIPLIFSPVEVDGRLLMDGGLANPVPADVAKKMGAECVIAVDVSSRWLETPEEMTTIKDMYSIISQTLSVLEYQLAKNILKQSADIVIKPPIFHYRWLEFGNSAEIVKLGKEEAQSRIEEIRKITGYKKRHATLGDKFLDFILTKPD